MYILGLTTLGDAAASLVCDGKLVAAAEEERFSRVKHHSGFPHNALQFCLDQAGIGIGDVEHVSLYWKPWILGRKAAQALKSLTISRDMFRARVDRGELVGFRSGRIGSLQIGAQAVEEIVQSRLADDRQCFAAQIANGKNWRDVR